MRSLPPATTAPSAAVGVWSGRLFLWPGRALYVGLASDTGAHAHHAIQVCLAIDTPFRLRSGAHGHWEEHDLALVAADREHQMDGRGAQLALLYLDPQTTDAEHLVGAVPRSGFALTPVSEWRSIAEKLRRCADTACDAEEARAVTEAVLACFSPSASPPSPRLDPRIARVVDHLRRSPESRLSAADAATLVSLSSHRFQHLFRDSTGIPFRRYRLWVRLVAAVETMARGASLTETAHAAGFADSAHLTRTFRRMFGLAPSVLAKGSEFVQAPSKRRP